MVRFAGVNYAANPSATSAEPRQAESGTSLGGGVNDSKGGGGGCDGGDDDDNDDDLTLRGYCF